MAIRALDTVYVYGINADYMFSLERSFQNFGNTNIGGGLGYGTGRLPLPAPPPAPPTVAPVPSPAVPGPAPAPVEELPTVVVSAPAVPTYSGAAAIASGLTFLPGYGAAAPRPRPAPRRRAPPRRRPAPKPAPRPRRRPGRPAPPQPRIRPLPARLLQGLARVVGRVFNPLTMLLWPSPLGGDDTILPGDQPVLVGGYDDDDQSRPEARVPDARGLPVPGSPIVGDVTITAPRLRESPSPALPAPELFAFGPSLDPGVAVFPIDVGARQPQPSPRPQPTPRPKPVPTPRTVPTPGVINAPLPAPIAAPAPNPRTRPVPRPSPRTPPATPIGAPILGAAPGTLTLPKPQPVPKEDPCEECKKQKKPKKKRQPRDVCWKGTFVEKPLSLVKIRKEKVPCQ